MLSKASIHRINSDIRWYKNNHPENYHVAKRTYDYLKAQFEQFPEAYCPEASYILKQAIPDTIFCIGKVGAINHYWNYDVANNVFIDITISQFPDFEEIPIMIMRNTDEKPAILDELGYKTYENWSDSSAALSNMGMIDDINLEGLTFLEIVDLITNTFYPN